MKNCILLLFLILGLGCSTLYGQETPEEQPAENQSAARPVTPKSMWEFAPTFGYLFVAGDVKPKFGYAGGISIRKATDYLFSLRLDLLYGNAEGQTVYGQGSQRNFELNWMSGTVFGVFGLNSLRFDKPVRNNHLYAMAGGGVNNFRVPQYTNEEVRNQEIVREFAPHVSIGAGYAFRLSPRMNIAIEHHSSMIFGGRADLVDGTSTAGNFRDLVNFTNIRLNFNIGNSQRRSEPLYWINPLQVVLDDIKELRENQGSAVALEDTDGDGVIDALDKEPTTAAGALVDTKGRTLDSDRDGVPDHLDREPYYTPREGELVDENGVVTNPRLGNGGVSEARVRELIEEALKTYQPAAGRAGGVTDLYLPMVHFGINSTTIKYSDYGTLASIARILKDNPNVRLVVKGFTDQTGSENYNLVLSYERSKAIVDHLVTNHGIARERLILKYGGQDNAIVPSNNSYMNRRVEFVMATANDLEMEPPAGYTPGKKSGY